MKWRPIETAPKGPEHEILVWGKDGGANSVNKVHLARWDYSCWVGYYSDPVPTHWMPLPAGPEEEEAEELTWKECYESRLHNKEE